MDIDIERSILLIWDLHPSLVQFSFNGEEVKQNVEQLVDWAHKKNVPVIFTKITPFPKGFEPPHSKNRAFNLDVSSLAINPSKEDIVVNKNTWSLFVGTNVELMLRNSNKNTIIITGIATDIGVETTARHAYALGFIPIIVRDAVSSSDKDAHDRSLLNMSKFFEVVNTKDILSI